MKLMEDTFIAYACTILNVAEETAGRMTIEAITKGGSDRCFYRLSLPDGKSYLFMAYGRHQEENAYWADIAAFLAALGVSVPAVYGPDPERGFVLMEDLGDRELWSYRHEPWDVRRDLYRKVLKRISPLHAFVGCSPTKGKRGGAVAMSPPLPKTMRGYNRELYRWEHEYFLTQFVGDVCGITLSGREGAVLKEELESLTGRLLVTGPPLVHRDLQSQNIMICRGEPVFIDFQGLRPGSLFYDLGSLLCDPYVPLTAEEREDLLRYAYELLTLDMDWTRFREGFLGGSAQRLMQALGAFGFLGLKKGKEGFLTHIPRGIENLGSMAAASGQLPHLLQLARRLK